MEFRPCVEVRATSPRAAAQPLSQEESGFLNADRHVPGQQVFEPPLLLGSPRDTSHDSAVIHVDVFARWDGWRPEGERRLRDRGRAFGPAITEPGAQGWTARPAPGYLHERRVLGTRRVGVGARWTIPRAATDILPAVAPVTGAPTGSPSKEGRSIPGPGFSDRRAEGRPRSRSRRSVDGHANNPSSTRIRMNYSQIVRCVPR